MAEGFDLPEAGMETAGDARNAPARARDAAASTGRDLLDRAVEKKDELKQRAGSMADDQRLHAADRVDAISRALHGAATSLRDSGESQLSGWVENAAGQVERLVGYLQGKPADGMLTDFEDLARRNPALFLGGTYLAGMAVGRFLRASTPTDRGDVAYTSDMDLGDAGGAPWTGVGVAPSVQGNTGLSATGAMGSTGGLNESAAMYSSGSTGMGRTSDAGDGEPGLTDEDMRDAWHGREEDRSTGGYGASSTDSSSEAIDTGELTSYTNDEDEFDRHDRGLDSDRGV